MIFKGISRKKSFKKSSTAIVATVFLLVQMMSCSVFAADGDITGSFAAKAPPTVSTIEAKTVDGTAIVTGAAVPDATIAGLSASLSMTINGTAISFTSAVVSAWSDLSSVATALQAKLDEASNTTVTVSSTGADPNRTLVLEGDANQSIVLSGAGLASIGLTAATTDPTTGVTNDLTPKDSYNIEVTVSDPDGIGTIDGGLTNLVTKLWYDATGAAKAESNFDDQTILGDDLKTCTTITWTKGTNTAAISSGAGGDWVLENSTLPSAEQLADSSVTSFTFIFQITVGEIATEASDDTMKWHLGAKATDSDNTTDYLAVTTSLDMNWYGKVAVTGTPTADWGRIDAGLAFADAAAKKQIDGIAFLANGVYDQSIKAASAFTNGATSVTRKLFAATEANTFSIEADRASTYATGTSGKIPALATDVTTITSGASAALTTGLAANTTLTPTSTTNYLYLSVNPSFADTGKVLSGTISFVIVNG